jgi:simple sugar transport system permease protein
VCRGEPCDGPAVGVDGLAVGLVGGGADVAAPGARAGRGFIALTAVIFGKWKPIPCFFACLLFGFADALQIELQSRSIFGIEVPIQAIQAFPYILTLLVLVGFVGRAKPPLALGKVL